MLMSFTKNITRVVFIFFLGLICLGFYYVLGGYKHYSILKNNESMIVNQVKKRFNIDLKYENLEEVWTYLKPSVKIKNLIVDDAKGNKITAGEVNIEVDVLKFVLADKLEFKKINVQDVYLHYNQKEVVTTEQGSEHTFNLSVLKNLSIDNLNFTNFSFDYTTPSKTYQLNDLTLDYQNGNDYVKMGYKSVDIYQYIPKDTKASKTVIRADMQDIVALVKNLGGQKYLDIAAYGKVYTIDGRIRLVVEVNRDEKNEIDYHVTANIPDNKVSLISQNFLFEHVKGDVTYDRDTGLNANNMTCIMNNKNCSFNLSNKNMKDVFVDFDVYATDKTLNKYAPFFTAGTFSGTTRVLGKYSSLYGKPDTLALKSDLVGMKVEKLLFANKAADTTSPLAINLTLSDNNNLLQIDNSNAIIFVDLLTTHTQVYLNKNDVKYTPKNENVYVDGTIDNVNVDEVLSFIKSLNFEKDKKSKKSSDVFTYRLNIESKKPKYLGFEPDYIYLTNTDDVLHIDIKDTNILGHIDYDIGQNALRGDFDKFNYIMADNDGPTGNVNTLRLSALPDMSMNFQDLTVHEYKGALSFQANHIDNAYVIDNLLGSINGFDANFKLKLKQDESGVIRSDLIGLNDNKLIEFDDIGSILSYYGYSNTMTSKKGVVYGNLSWTGLAPNLKTLSGDLRIEIDDGRINVVSTGQKVLNVFRIFEVNTLNQLFSLDFDIMKTGIQYDKVTGTGKFIEGVLNISTNKPITMTSKSFKAKVEGDIDFVNEKFNNRVIVDLPISQKLPVIALLAGGPAAAAGVWIVDKMVGDKLNSLMSIGVTLKGGFEKPAVDKK
jgi:uncharacterized protein YhdP